MDSSSMTISKAYPAFATPAFDRYVMSGTSQAAAVTSGVVALMIQAHPSLTPDQIKCQLIASAAGLVGSSGKAAYSIFQQGAGLVNAYKAINSQATNCANVGLNIAADIAGTKHYGGPAHQDAATGQFYLVDASGKPMSADGYMWNNTFARNQGYMWNNGYLWNNGYMWNNGFLWNNGYMWNNGYLWNLSTVTPASKAMGSESWNNQE
jgi:hypothetical protein